MAENLYDFASGDTADWFGADADNPRDFSDDRYLDDSTEDFYKDMSWQESPRSSHTDLLGTGKATTAWVKVGLAVVLFLLGFLGNIYVLLKIGKRKKFEKDPINWYLFNEVIVNTLFTLTFPILLAEDVFTEATSFRTAICLTRETIMFANHFCAIIFLVFIGTVVQDSVKSIDHHASHQHNVSPYLATGLTWTACVIIAMLTALLRKLAAAAVGTVVFTVFSAIVFLVASNVLCYRLAQIARYKLRLRRSCKKNGLKMEEIPTIKIQDGSSSGSESSVTAKNETIVMCGLMFLWMLLCCIPFHVLRILEEYSSFEVYRTCGPYHVWSYFLLFANATVNPWFWIGYHHCSTSRDEETKKAMSEDTES